MKATRHIRPQVLLLGNGIIRAYSSLAMSWKDMLRRIGTDHSIPDDLNIPMPLEIVVRTGNHVDVVLRDHSRELYGAVETDDFGYVLRELLGMGFDHILTTNYSYEMEQAAAGAVTLSDEELAAMRRQTGSVSRSKHPSLLFTYNYAECGDCPNRIWHIHGEARDPDSIVLGHQFYGNLLSRCRDYLTQCGGEDMILSRDKEIRSWIDAFMLGDIYTVGFGYDFSEMDLWWLLDCKKSQDRHTGGSFYYYRPGKQEAFDVKSVLLRDYGAKVVNFGEREPDEGVNEYYRGFYLRCIDDIRHKMKAAENAGFLDSSAAGIASGV